MIFVTLGRVLKEKELKEEKKELDKVDMLSCIDGCHSCVMFNEVCNEILNQDIGPSRNLVKWVLEVLLGKVSFHGSGRNSGAAILQSAIKVLIAISPYLDSDGLSLLKELIGRGVEIYLVTSKKTYEKYKEQLKGIASNKLKVCIYEEAFHFQNYAIDNGVVVSTSWNLSGFNSINEFRLEMFEGKSANSIDQVIGNCRWI